MQRNTLIARSGRALCRPSRRCLSPRVLSTVAPSPPPVSPRKAGFYTRNPRFASFLQRLGLATLVTVFGGGATLYYVSQRARHPGNQLEHDPSKKTLVVLGSGWGATSLLKAIDTEDYNVVVVSPKNYFLFTPLLPSVAAGTLSPRSIIQSIRYITRHKKRQVAVIEAEAQKIDPLNRTVTFSDTSEIQGKVSSTTIPYDYLVVAVGAETQTFGIPGVKEHACFMKELRDAERLQRQFMDCIESAAFPGQSPEEVDRLLHLVVVGGGPTGVELSGEIHDFLENDLKAWYPELAGRVRITLVEALPRVLPSFSQRLVSYTESTFRDQKIEILTGTMVKGVTEKSVQLQKGGKDGVIEDVPCGTVVWAAGNTAKGVVKDLMAQVPSAQTNKRGITIDDHLQMAGTQNTIFALGDCTSTQYAPTAQVASQQGAYLAKVFKQLAKRDAIAAALGPSVSEEEKTKAMEKVKVRPFHYSHQGSLAYIGSDKAIADLSIFKENFASGGVLTYFFWRSAYLSTLFSMRNRTLVATDWMKTKVFGRDVSRE